MLWWGRPRCPVEPETKAWIEERFAWLQRSFGRERVREATTVEPTPAFFPDPFQGTPACAERMFARVCGYMGVARDTVELCFYAREEDANEALASRWSHSWSSSGAAGLYERDDGGGPARIWIETSHLGNPLSLVATMAHELGHVHLIGGGRLADETGDDDHEPLTDLLTVFLGLGIFTANSAVHQHTWYDAASGYSGWSVGRLGYLRFPEYGYALALFAWLRGEARPAWAKHLRPDVRDPFRRGLAYLEKTGDTTVTR